MTPPRHPALVTAMRPLAGLYRLAVATRNARFDRGVGVTRAAMPVISVGNLEAGGTGKTPMVVWLIQELRRRGRVPSVVTRGYGGSAGTGPFDVSRGEGPIAGADRAGDEPVMVAAQTRAIVVAGSDRARGVARAMELGSDVAILDDGFQHRRLARDLDIVLLDATRPFGNGCLLPAGSLREPPASLFRAGVIVLTRWTDAGGPSGLGAVHALGAPAPIVRAIHRRAGFKNAAGSSVAAPRRAVAFCGIARPESFLEDLRTEGVEVASVFIFPDHHAFTATEIARIVDHASASNATLVTTAKDWARLGSGGPPSTLTLQLDLALLDPAPMIKAVDRALGGRS